MNAQILTASTLAFLYAGVLPAKAADPQLVGLVMPDAQVLAGVNVEQAKVTPFGQYVLSQIRTSDPQFQELIALTGFDPTRDVREVLVASNGGTATHAGLVVARGTFDSNKIAAAAVDKGAVTETYNGVTIIEEPKKSAGVAFLFSSTVVVAGDLANVKAAIDRQNSPSSLPSALAVQVDHWSGTQDAWAISAVPLSTLHPPAGAPKVPGLNGQGTFQAIQQAASGVKFGALVVVTAEVKADTAENAKSMGDALKLLANLVQMQAANEPAAAALAQSLTVSTQGNTLNVTVSLPQDQLQQVVQTPKRPAARRQGSAIRK